MRKKICCLFYIMTVICLALMLGGCSGDQASDAAEEQDTVVEASEFSDLNDFTAETSDGEEITQSYFEDHDVTIINIWATFCQPCLKEMPELAEIEASRPDNIGMMLICADALNEPEYMQEIIETTGYTGINLINGDGDYTKLLGDIQFVPTTIFVDREGNVVGEPVIGAPEDPETIYYKHINDYLKEAGLETAD